MPDSASRLPARPSLEQLRKQAKERLRAMRETNPATTLAEAQYALAGDYGFESWPRLVHHVESLSASRAAGTDRLGISNQPPYYKIDAERRTIMVHTTLSDAEWDTIFAVMRERQLTGLEASGMTDGAMARLARLDFVTRVLVGGARAVTDDGLRHLSNLTRLGELELGGQHSPLTDRGLEVLRDLPSLKEFRACWTPRFTDAGAANLSFCDQLEDVNLMGTPTGNGAINALRGKRHLRKLSTGTGVSDAGIPLLHDLPMFARWHGGETKYDLMSFSAEPTSLLLDGPFTNAGLARLGGLDGLFSLNFFWHCPHLTGEGLSVLPQMGNLGFLGCHVTRDVDPAMGHIAAIPRLRMLMAQGTTASDAGFEALSRSQTIEYIWGRECPNLSGRGFVALASMPALRGLAVSCLRVDDAALSALPRFPALRQLLPMDVRDDGFRHVGQCHLLENLWCMYCRDTGDAATGHLSGLTHLKSYYAGKTLITDRSLEILACLTSLERLEFWQCAGITDAGLRHLAALPNVKEITFDGLPGVTRAGAGALPAHVRVNYAP